MYEKEENPGCLAYSIVIAILLFAFFLKIVVPIHLIILVAGGNPIIGGDVFLLIASVIAWVFL